MVVNLAAKNLLQKANSLPDLVRQTVDKARRGGLLAMVETLPDRFN